jgi:steroid delta-isomerase-like uncharacterized protein
MSDLQELVRTHYEGVNGGDLDKALSVFDPDCEIVTPQGPMRGAAAQRALGEAFKAAVPDNRLEALRIFEAGDTVIVEGVYSGTQTGDLVGPGGTVPASGRSFSLPYVDLFQVRDGKIVAHRIYWDNATLMAQLGAMPGA